MQLASIVEVFSDVNEFATNDQLKAALMSVQPLVEEISQLIRDRATQHTTGGSSKKKNPSYSSPFSHCNSDVVMKGDQDALDKFDRQYRQPRERFGIGLAVQTAQTAEAIKEAGKSSCVHLTLGDTI